MSNESIKRHLEWVSNAGTGATVENFDYDHDPVGPMMRELLVPKYVTVSDDGGMALTEAGQAVLG